MPKCLSRRARSLVLASGMTAAALFGAQAMAAANDHDTRSGPAGQLPTPMDPDDPGMTETHGAMTQDRHNRDAHERMMRDPDMVQMHSTMMG